ncbi:MAG TPA: threonylcarbamoyl-AMP synthase [Lentisphaeria bacterium]|nr:MAG: threonylcarbamoyl-AMP synthase [Lentisphaerae bacterium GWF2_50_93]HCE44716.1 threonylcarbamoyl-AMP synthase [Lentisphaeria bacterium]
MKVLRSLNNAGNPLLIGECSEMLSEKKGMVLLLPTETVYGFMCRWDDQQARERIYRMKRRDPDKPFQMLASSIAQAEKEGLIFEGEAEIIAGKFFPGAMTLVVKNKNGGTTGLRIPDHPLTLELTRKINSPLAATSANISGEPAALTLEDALKNLEILPDIAVDGGEIKAGIASTVVDATSTPFRILRQGPIKEEEIRRAINK